MGLTIPASINDIDSQWLSHVIAAPVQRFEFTQIGQGVGIMGDIYRVNLHYAGTSTGPASVVVKLPSSFEENRAQGIALGMFESEVRFYNELAQQANVGIPQVYLASIITGTAEFVIVMEDLSDHRLVDQQVGMTLAEARAAVDVLANIHAVWWNAVQTPTLDWIPSITGPRINFVDQVLPGVFANFAQGFQAVLPTGGLELFEAFVGNYAKITQVIAKRSPWTLLHQDFRVENLLFSTTNPHTVMVLDWQGIGRGPGAYDLAYLLGGSMCSANRTSDEKELVSRYHQALQRQGVQDYTLDQCQTDYKLAHLMGGLATPILIGGAMDLSNERGIELVNTMASRHVQAALDHDGLNLLTQIIG